MAPLLYLSSKKNPIYLHPSGGYSIRRYERCYDWGSHTRRFCGCGPTPSLLSSLGDVLRGWQSSAFLVGEEERTAMPMSLKEEIRLLSMVDILGPLSDEEMEDLAKRTPDTFLEQDDVLYTPKDGTERLFVLKEGRVQLYQVNREGEEI